MDWVRAAADHIAGLFRDEGEPEAIIQYGSSLRTSEPRDVDLLVLTRGQRTSEAIVIGQADLRIQGVYDTIRFLEKLDPIRGTEPFMTGRLVAGDQLLFDGLAAFARGQKSTSASQDLARSAVEREIQQAAECYEAGHWRWAIEYATNAALYELFKRHYSEPGTHARRLDELLEAGPPEVRRLRSERRSLRYGEHVPTQMLAADFLSVAKAVIEESN